jgi:hypothetical protein
VRLAEAIPRAEKYAWRPSSDVRTVAEVFLHASAANCNLYRLVGTPTPAMTFACRWWTAPGFSGRPQSCSTSPSIWVSKSPTPAR